jgi:hypothetical protein
MEGGGFVVPDRQGPRYAKLLQILWRGQSDAHAMQRS